MEEEETESNAKSASLSKSLWLGMTAPVCSDSEFHRHEKSHTLR